MGNWRLLLPPVMGERLVGVGHAVRVILLLDGVAAIVGGAIVPELQGLLADRIGIHHAFILPVICYLYIAYYGFRGSKHAAVAAPAQS